MVHGLIPVNRALFLYALHAISIYKYTHLLVPGASVFDCPVCNFILGREDCLSKFLGPRINGRVVHVFCKRNHLLSAQKTVVFVNSRCPLLYVRLIENFKKITFILKFELWHIHVLNFTTFYLV